MAGAEETLNTESGPTQITRYREREREKVKDALSEKPNEQRKGLAVESWPRTSICTGRRSKRPLGAPTGHLRQRARLMNNA